MYRARRRNPLLLWALIVLAALCSAALHFLSTPPDRMLLVGSVSLAFGLFVCAQPAANALDALLYERYILRPTSTWRANLPWLALNLLALAAGWLTILEAIGRFVDMGH